MNANEHANVWVRTAEAMKDRTAEAVNKGELAEAKRLATLGIFAGEVAQAYAKVSLVAKATEGNKSDE